MKTKNQNAKTVIKVSVITLIVNMGLTAFKLIVGLLSSSFALVSDAVHSASYVFSTLIVMAVVLMSEK
ncbi:MAG: cation transporter, partial [Clostridiales bacterium]|nr:cation transporter [Clostridiales bacterium]